MDRNAKETLNYWASFNPAGTIASGFTSDEISDSVHENTVICHSEKNNVA